VPRPRHRHTLTARVVPVVDPDADAAFDAVLDLLADALADLAIRDARAEVAARLGVAPESIDREPAALDADDRSWLDAVALRGAA
jgi:hypothetical protein